MSYRPNILGLISIKNSPQFDAILEQIEHFYFGNRYKENPLNNFLIF